MYITPSHSSVFHSTTLFFTSPSTVRVKKKMKEAAEESITPTSSENEEKKLLHYHSPPPPPRKGGFRTIPFILVNESFEKVASYGMMPNMIIYLMHSYSMEAASATIFISLWSAMSNLLTVFGAFLSDSYLGRFSVVLLGSFSSLLGMTLLWLTAISPELKPPPCEQYLNSHCIPPTTSQFAVLIAALGLMSLGSGCIRPCSITFGADQLYNEENLGNERTIQRYFNWYYVTGGISAVVALTVIVFIQDTFGWGVGFGVPVVLMFLSTLIFLLGSRLFVKVKAGESLFTGFVQVVVAAVKKRKMSLSIGDDSGDCYYHLNREPKIIVPTNILRSLNKACIVKNPETELNPDGSSSNPWRLCSVDQVESLKSLLRIFPIMSAGVMVMISMSNPYGTLQAKTMNRHITASIEIPAGSFFVFLVISITLWITFYDCIMVPLLAKRTARPNGIDPKLRMGIGLIITILAVLVSALVEAKRRKKAIESGLEDDPEAVMDMSAMWLVPQYVVFGIAEGFYMIGQLEFFYTEFPKSMASIAVALTAVVTAVSGLVGSVLVKIVNVVTASGGKESWLDSNLNRGHLDYYFWLLAFLASLNFAYFLYCCRAYGDGKHRSAKVLDGGDGGECDYRELPSA